MRDFEPMRSAEKECGPAAVKLTTHGRLTGIPARTFNPILCDE
jgi:hypothetical protein